MIIYLFQNFHIHRRFTHKRVSASSVISSRSSEKADNSPIKEIEYA
ncbi:hypothetical protein NEIMUCOT_04878 [Neisseria mucosa ATCC 25996]|uniref:Uncharacterized protein n=1 Tax=Neisseria mucosa (strain ATCC 25996 / DSM 4631 / NCTC 10774 / M26) TaxID=546266 RepID=D2ZW85_NEIM2|nr:hypothetical protein NEIMUCOT_04878 [Neisseria mucosa ATCC 25996]